MFDREQAGAVARFGIARRQRQRLRLVRIILAEHGAEELRERIVQRVEPDHRLAAGMAVIVPAPIRRQHEIARMHRHALAFDGRISAAAFDDETHGVRGVAMGAGDFARQDDLHAGIERTGDIAAAGQPRIFQHQHPAFGLLGRDQFRRPQQLRTHVSVFPDRRHGCRSGPMRVVRSHSGLALSAARLSE